MPRDRLICVYRGSTAAQAAAAAAPCLRNLKHTALPGRTLKFLANVDPVDVARALEGLDAEETLVVVVSHAYTSSELLQCAAR